MDQKQTSVHILDSLNKTTSLKLSNDSLSLGTTTYTVSEGMASRLQGYCPLGAFHNLFEQCQNTQHQLLVKVTSEIYQYVVNVILLRYFTERSLY
uniref:Uncharacterized protein n=1 Tax=Gouania willdenowi TaxID=441366 RepID=A0A8C5H060_GOUWI